LLPKKEGLGKQCVWLNSRTIVVRAIGKIQALPITINYIYYTYVIDRSISYSKFEKSFQKE